MSRQGLTLLGLGGGHNPITHIRLVLCMKTPLDKTPQHITVHRCYQCTTPTPCCRFNNNSNNNLPNHLIHHNNLRKRTVHIQTVQWRLHNHNRSLRHRRRATHLFHHRQVMNFVTNRCGFSIFMPWWHSSNISRSPSHTRTPSSKAKRLWRRIAFETAVGLRSAVRLQLHTGISVHRTRPKGLLSIISRSVCSSELLDRRLLLWWNWRFSFTALLESRPTVSGGGEANHHAPSDRDHVERPKFLRKHVHQQLKIVHKRCCWLSINR